MNDLTEQLLCHRVVGLLLRQFARLTGNQAVTSLPIHVVLEDADTASVGQREGSEEIVITIPREFAWQEVMSNSNASSSLLLGLAAHEMGHLPDLEEVLRLIREIEEQGEHAFLKTVFGIVEDIRNESRMMDEPIGNWLADTRQAVLDEGNEEETPRTLWDLLWRLRFSNPALPWSAARPVDEDGRDLFATNEYLFHASAVDRIEQVLDKGPQESLAAARDIFRWAREYDIPIPEPPPWWLLVMGSGRHPSAGEQGQAVIQAVQEQGKLSPGGDDLKAGAGSSVYEQGPPDREALAKGHRLACQIRQGWTQRRQGAVGVGVGRYDPRLDGRGLPPFALPLSRRRSLPKKLLLLLDVSDSMYTSGCQNLHIARTVVAAIALAAKETGGQVVIAPFWCGYTIANGLEHALSIRGYGTQLVWLPRLLERYPDYDVLMVTDAEVGVPAGWDERKRARTTVVLVPLPRKGPQTGRAGELAHRVLPVERPEDLPYLVALAARATMGTQA